MEEIWRPVKGYESLYMLSNEGQIYSHPRPYCEGGYNWGHKCGKYLQICLSKNSKIVNRYIHRLVYETFIGDIPNGYDVHHINHNREDNRVENLCLKKSLDHKKEHSIEAIKINSKPVIQFTKDGQFVTEYPSIAEASRQTGINHNQINGCCLNKPHYKTAGGYIWKYTA